MVTSPPGMVRIIGGQWRGRKVQVVADANVRPTPDRVRETVFNWLMPYLPGARCLDLFAGSGVLGLEALSRGAGHVTFVDAAPNVVAQITRQLAIFGIKTAQNAQAQAKVYLAIIPEQLTAQLTDQSYDIVFLDPPYHANLLFPTCHSLATQGVLKPSAIIYLESGTEILEQQLPKTWQILKAKHTRHVYYYLIKAE